MNPADKRLAIMVDPSTRTTGKEWLLMKKADAAADPQFVIVSALTPAVRRRLVETAPPCDTT